MTQLYEAIASRTTYYRVVVEADNTKEFAYRVLDEMEQNGRDVEQYRAKGFLYVEGEDYYGENTAVLPAAWNPVAIPQTMGAINGWAIALPADTNETADIQANVAG